MLLRLACLPAVILALHAAFVRADSPQADTLEPAAAQAVMQRFLGDRAADFTFEKIPDDHGLDVYQVDASGGKVHVQGSSPVAMCHGAYDYLRNSCNVQDTWSGKNLDLPDKFLDAPTTRIVCPFRWREYYNACTFGYTTAFWGWNQWQHELDWMALHGINMAIANVAAEAIWQRVWLDEGITQDELDHFFTGPAFLAWNRMGNVNGHDGPLPQSWQDKTVILQKQILARMRQLGIEPIAPAFAGYVPAGFDRVHPDAKLDHLPSWSGFSQPYRTILLDPESPYFSEIGRKYTEAWEKEFGHASYFLADTFNEMQVPVPPDRAGRLARLADYGQAVFKAVTAAQSDAIWVMQGWVLYKHEKFWDLGSVQAYLSKVPDDQMIILDLATEIKPVWKMDHSFFGKSWICSVILNFGGKPAIGGNLAFYAKNAADTLASSERGKLVGFGMAPEGIENNEAAFELMTDSAWSTSPIDLEDWIHRYCRDRYGADPDNMRQAWSLLEKTVYTKSNIYDLCPGYQHHPQYNPKLPQWGNLPDDSPEFHQAVQLFLDCSGELGKSELYREDMIELVTQYDNSRIDDLILKALAAHKGGNAAERDRYSGEAFDLMDDVDALLDCHPLDRLQRRVDQARAWADPGDTKLADYYEQDGKRQITVWGGPELSEYASKTWSGITRGYYEGRWRQYFDYLAKGGDPMKFSIHAWEEKWITTPGVPAPVRKIDDPIVEAKRLFAKGEQLQQNP